MSTLVSNTALVVTNCWCGVEYAVPKSLYDMQKAQSDNGEAQRGIYCPSGHQWTFSGEPAIKRVERELQRERQRADQIKAELSATTARLNAEKSAKSRLKNRVKHGVCPCCNRTFENLARHMKTKHAEYLEPAP